MTALSTNATEHAKSNNHGADYDGQDKQFGKGKTEHDQLPAYLRVAPARRARQTSYH